MREAEQSCANQAAVYDFAIQKYDLDRAHELELNKFTHVLEMERLKLLLALNGGAAGLWVTFAKSVKNAMASIALALPVIFWIAGVIAASIAIDHTLKSQRGYTSAYHKRRRADEWWLLSQDHEPDLLANILYNPAGDAGLTPQEAAKAAEITYRKQADEQAQIGKDANDRVKNIVYVSVIAFILGAGFALMGMIFS